MPIDESPEGVSVTANDFAWTRARFGPPRITKGADLVGTSLVETGVVDGGRYLEAVRSLATVHGATRYFAHRRESAEKLHTLAAETGLEIVRPDLPLELIARRGPIGRTILSFPSTVVHTLPLALAGTDVRVAVCDIDPSWLTENASPAHRASCPGSPARHGTSTACRRWRRSETILAAAPRARLRELRCACSAPGVPLRVFALGASEAVASPVGPRLSCRVAGEGEVASPAAGGRRRHRRPRHEEDPPAGRRHGPLRTGRAPPLHARLGPGRPARACSCSAPPRSCSAPRATALRC